MMDKLARLARQRRVDMEDILDSARHIKMEEKQIAKAIKEINKGFVNLEKAIMSAKK